MQHIATTTSGAAPKRQASNARTTVPLTPSSGSVSRTPCACGGGCPRCGDSAPAIRSLSQPHDPHEQEAERVADQLVHAPSPAEHEPTLAPATVPSMRDLAPGLRTSGASRAGEPLAAGTRSFFEPRLGADLSNVRVHTDARADTAARAINARAFTAGSDIAFRAGRYDPNSAEGKRLLAHELTHVVQAGIDAGSRWRAAGAPAINARIAPNLVSRDIEQATPDTSQYSGTELETEIAQLRARLEQLPQDVDSEERDTIERRLAALEANLVERQSAVQASSIVTDQLRRSSLPIDNRISMAFGAGFAAGAIMEYRPAEAQRLIAEIRDNPGHFGGGILVGLLEGAVLDLWNNIVGIAELALWLTPQYWVYRAGREALDYLSDPAAYRRMLAERQAQAEALMSGLGELVRAVGHDPNILVTYGAEFGQLAGQRAAQWFNDDFMRRTPYEKGETVGEVVGTIIMEVALLFVGPEEWIARAGAAAGEAVRVSARLERAIVELMEHIPSLRRLLELRRAAGGAHVLEEAGQGARALEHATTGARDVERSTQAARDAERLTAGARDTEQLTTGARDAEHVTTGTQDAERAAHPGDTPPGGGDRPPDTGGGGSGGWSELDAWEQEELRALQEDLDAHGLDWSDLGYADQRAVLDAVMRHPNRAELIADMNLRLNEQIARVESGATMTRETRDMLSGAREWEGETRATPDELGELGESPGPLRFDWHESERELSLLQAEFPELPPEGWRTQRPVRGGQVLDTGRTPRGATVPERYHPGGNGHPPVSLEAKNYFIDDAAVGEDPMLMQEFLERTADQARRRATQLPADAQQYILIDLRGQEVSAATRAGIVRDLVALSDGALQADRIRFLPP